MAGKNSKRAAAAAQACGMRKQHWSAVKAQAHAARARGRRAESEKKLATWGDVEGQEVLFDTGGTDND